MASVIKTSDSEQNVLLSDAFMRVFITTCGHYKQFIPNSIFDVSIIIIIMFIEEHSFYVYSRKMDL